MLRRMKISLVMGVIAVLVTTWAVLVTGPRF
jgi:hypothetical protein